jgi:hypothetical protein
LAQDQSSVIGIVLKSLRMVRFLKLYSYIQNSSVIWDILSLSMPYLINTFLILSVIFYIYTIIGMNLFPYIKRREGITNNTNFSHFGLAVYTLISISTGENWNAVLEDCLKQSRSNDVCLNIWNYNDFEKNGKEYYGCGTNIAYFYFISFIMIFAYTLLNLLAGMIIETFYLRARLAGMKVKGRDIQNFFLIWQALETPDLGMLHWKEAKNFLLLLKPPLGLPKENAKQEILDSLWTKLRLPLYKHKGTREIYIHVYDMMLALAKFQYQNSEGFEE